MAEPHGHPAGPAHCPTPSGPTLRTRRPPLCAEGDAAWHGGCLAVAELARRGLLLPARLAPLTPTIRAALAYDVRRGAHSIGAHVRDAAAYVCWAFARAYAPELMQHSVAEVSSALLAVACYDREVGWGAGWAGWGAAGVACGWAKPWVSCPGPPHPPTHTHTRCLLNPPKTGPALLLLGCTPTAATGYSLAYPGLGAVD